MDKGKLICRDRSGKGLLYLMLLVGLLIDVSILFGEVGGSLFELLVINLCFIYIPYKLIEQANSVPGFYEHGVGYFKNNRCTHWVPYHHFIGFECFIQREGVRNAKECPTYGLIFHQSDGTFVEIEKQSVQELQKIWQAILKENPYLIDRLIVDAPMERVYELTTDSNKRLTLAERARRKAYHPASEILFNVLKNTK